MCKALCHWPVIHYGTAEATCCLKESPQAPYAEKVLAVTVTTSAMPKPGYVYILSSKPNGTLYIGVTSDLARRVYQHREGVVEGFAKRHDVARLVYYEQHADTGMRSSGRSTSNNGYDAGSCVSSGSTTRGGKTFTRRCSR